MSVNKNYKKQFDRNAGHPAEFDSLFRFEKNELIAKKKIRARKTNKHLAVSAVSAAAFIAAAVMGLTYLSTDSITSSSSDQSITELSTAAEQLETTAAIDYIQGRGAADINTQYFSPLLFDYSFAGDDNSAEYTYNSVDVYEADIIMLANVIKKTISDDKITYDICCDTYYSAVFPTLNETDSTDKSTAYSVTSRNISFTVHISEDHHSYSELQPGSSYILFFDASNEKLDPNLELLYTNHLPIRKSGSSWVIPDDYTAFANTVSELNTSYSNDSCAIIQSDDEMREILRMVFDASEEKYYLYQYQEVNAPVSSFDYIFNTGDSGYGFESVSYYKDDSGNIDTTTLVLNNKEYFDLIPAISGTVTFAGKSLNGDNIVVIEPSDDSISLIMFSGLYDLDVTANQSINCSKLGSCSNSPVYCCAIDNNGQKIIITDIE